MKATIENKGIASLPEIESDGIIIKPTKEQQKQKTLKRKKPV